MLKVKPYTEVLVTIYYKFFSFQNCKDIYRTCVDTYWPDYWSLKFGTWYEQETVFLHKYEWQFCLEAKNFKISQNHINNLTEMSLPELLSFIMKYICMRNMYENLAWRQNFHNIVFLCDFGKFREISLRILPKCVLQKFSINL